MNAIRDHIKMRITKKFIAGAEEHGGDLTDKSVSELLEDILDEIVDLCAYTVTLRIKVKELEDAAAESVETQMPAKP